MSRPRRRSRAALRRELETRDAFLARVSQGLSERVRALTAAPSPELEALHGFARELAIIAGDREARRPRRAPLDVGLHVFEIVEGWRRRYGERASGSTLDVERTGSLVASVDADHVSSILAELVTNAHKYGGGRPIRVLVDEEGEHVRIIVEDQGPGFTPRGASDSASCAAQRRRAYQASASGSGSHKRSRRRTAAGSASPHGAGVGRGPSSRCGAKRPEHVTSRETARPGRVEQTGLRASR